MPITGARIISRSGVTPVVSDADRVAMVSVRRSRPDVVIDTDTNNEIDDQFALSYALLNPHLNVAALYAAPFVNRKASNARDGMVQSFDEIRRMLTLTGAEVPSFLGAEDWVSDAAGLSPAARDLIERSADYDSERPLYVVALGAPTDIAQALLHEPEIGTRIVVVWLGAEPSTWYRGKCYNAEQDLVATNVLFDGVAPLVHIPASNVTEHLRTTRAEMLERMQPLGDLARYLVQIYDEYAARDGCTSKELWDLGPLAWVAHPDWVRTTYVVSPYLTADGAWGRHPERPLMAEAYTLNVDAILGEMYELLAGQGTL